VEAELKCKLLLLVGPGEDEIAAEIVGKSSARIVNTGPDKVDLGLLKPVIRRCNLLVTNDTGPRHYATAMDIPVVVLMGPTDPRWTQSHLDKTTVLRKDLPCAPCHEKVCKTGRHQCMRTITPEEVARAVNKLLGRR